MQHTDHHHCSHSTAHKVSFAGLLITIGIIFGDIGTSPLYVFRAIFSSIPVDRFVVLGCLSAIFWTITLQTTVKYVVFTLNADNNGEGGIFSLYTLVRRLNKRWLMLPAIAGGGMLLADGMITPAISVSSAIEGIQMMPMFRDFNTVPVVVVILTILFMAQQFGTKHIGKIFGPVMVVWFSMLAIFGAYSLIQSPEVIVALNPMYAIKLIALYPSGFWLLGAIFLCTTGAEGLYFDMGHCGRSNIRITWGFVKICLLLSYFGQGAWLYRHQQMLDSHINPFFSIIPEWFLIPGIVISTCAAVIASQALISGSFTLINEATRLGFWFRTRIVYPTDIRGQLYIPSVNWLLWVGCVLMVFYFRSSAYMEAAYGLAIVVTMIMTTILMFYYLRMHRHSLLAVWAFCGGYFTLEGAFLVANLKKVLHGGWVTSLLGFMFLLMMFAYSKAKKTVAQQTSFVPIEPSLGLLSELSNDESVPKYSTHLVYLTSCDRSSEIEAKIIHSILYRQPKRADVYWFVHINVSDEPFRMDYKVTSLSQDDVVRVDFFLGFRVLPRVNVLFRKVLQDIAQTGEIEVASRYLSLGQKRAFGDIRYVILKNFLSYEQDLPFMERVILRFYFLIKRISLSDAEAFGLDASSVVVEKCPLITKHVAGGIKLNRIH